MEQQLLREFQIFEAEDVQPSSNSDGIITMKGVIQKANQPNANKRIYPKAILHREDQKMQQSIGERRALGELDHPDSPVVQLENVSHVLTKTHWEGDTLIGEIEVLDTPKGQILSKLIERKIKLGISSRGLGSTKRTNEGYDMVEDDFSMICYDMVSNPSTSGAFMHLREHAEYRAFFIENKIMLLDEILNDILKLESYS